MKKMIILIAAVIAVCSLLCACNAAEVIPTLPMETITPTPANQPSAMPTLIPTLPEMTMPVTETQPAASSTASGAAN